MTAEPLVRPAQNAPVRFRNRRGVLLACPEQRLYVTLLVDGTLRFCRMADDNGPELKGGAINWLPQAVPPGPGCLALINDFFGTKRLQMEDFGACWRKIPGHIYQGEYLVCAEGVFHRARRGAPVTLYCTHEKTPARFKLAYQNASELPPGRRRLWDGDTQAD